MNFTHDHSNVLPDTVWTVGSCTRAEVASSPGCHSPRGVFRCAGGGERGRIGAYLVSVHSLCSPHPGNSPLPAPSRRGAVRAFLRPLSAAALQTFPCSPYITAGSPPFIGEQFLLAPRPCSISKASQLVFIKT